jgi:hypothetical protein
MDETSVKKANFLAISCIVYADKLIICSAYFAGFNYIWIYWQLPWKIIHLNEKV